MPKIPQGLTPQDSDGHSIYLGIDPGISGGLCAISDKGVVVDPMPPTERDIWKWISYWHQGVREQMDKDQAFVMFCVIEKIQPAIFKISKGASSKLFGNYSALRMALIAASIPFQEVPAPTWQAALGLPRKKDEKSSKWKNRLKALAQQLFPNEHVTLKTADSILIAEYCRRKNEGLL